MWVRTTSRRVRGPAPGSSEGRRKVQHGTEAKKTLILIPNQRDDADSPKKMVTSVPVSAAQQSRGHQASMNYAVCSEMMQTRKQWVTSALVCSTVVKGPSSVFEPCRVHA